MNSEAGRIASKIEHVLKPSGRLVLWRRSSSLPALGSPAYQRRLNRELNAQAAAELAAAADRPHSQPDYVDPMPGWLHKVYEERDARQPAPLPRAAGVDGWTEYHPHTPPELVG